MSNYDSGIIVFSSAVFVLASLVQLPWLLLMQLFPNRTHSYDYHIWATLLVHILQLQFKIEMRIQLQTIKVLMSCINFTCRNSSSLVLKVILVMNNKYDHTLNIVFYTATHSSTVFTTTLSYVYPPTIINLSGDGLTIKQSHQSPPTLHLLANEWSGLCHQWSLAVYWEW